MSEPAGSTQSIHQGHVSGLVSILGRPVIETVNIFASTPEAASCWHSFSIAESLATPEGWNAIVLKPMLDISNSTMPGSSGC